MHASINFAVSLQPSASDANDLITKALLRRTFYRIHLLVASVSDVRDLSHGVFIFLIIR